jgi:Arc/MetJ family transcription regulator
MADDSPQPKKKGVGFRTGDAIEEVKRISRYSNYNMAEIEAYWGDGSEAKLRKQELRTTVQEWQQGKRMSDNLTFTTRGIMDKIGEGKHVKKANREKARQAVMDEQELQDQEGMIDDTLLAEIYESTTIASKKKAHNEAMAVREEVDGFVGGEEDNAEKDT